jgi:uncharacterized protein
MKILHIYFLLLLTNFSFLQTVNSTNQHLPRLSKYVNDNEEIFQWFQINILNENLKVYEKKSTNEIVILTTASIEPYTNMYNYSLDLANNSGIGKKDKNNGVLIVISKKLRQLQIQVGDGITDKLTNKECKSILKTIISYFKKDDFFKGIEKAIEQIKKELNK